MQYLIEQRKIRKEQLPLFAFSGAIFKIIYKNNLSGKKILLPLQPY